MKQKKTEMHLNLKFTSGFRTYFCHVLLEQRQYRNDSFQSKIIPILNLPPFSLRRISGEKERQFQNWNYFCLSSSKDVSLPRDVRKKHPNSVTSILQIENPDLRKSK